MGYERDGYIRFTGKAIDLIKNYVVEGQDVYDEGVTFFDFDHFFENSDVESEWSGLEECSFWEEKGVGYLLFSFYGTFVSFPYGIAIKLSKDFPEQEIGVYYTVEMHGTYLNVFKNGEMVFEDDIDDDMNSDEGEEIPEKYNPTTIKWDNFFQKREEPRMSPDERERQSRIFQEEWDFKKNKDKYLKNSDGTFVITEEMSEGAKKAAKELNEIIIAKANEPTYEEVVKELERNSITIEERMKAVRWLEHHKTLSEGFHRRIVTKDMPILVKAFILFERKKDSESDDEWEEMLSDIKKDDN